MPECGNLRCADGGRTVGPRRVCLGDRCNTYMLLLNNHQGGDPSIRKNSLYKKYNV